MQCFIAHSLNVVGQDTWQVSRTGSHSDSFYCYIPKARAIIPYTKNKGQIRSEITIMELLRFCWFPRFLNLLLGDIVKQIILCMWSSLWEATFLTSIN